MLQQSGQGGSWLESILSCFAQNNLQIYEFKGVEEFIIIGDELLR